MEFSKRIPLDMRYKPDTEEIIARMKQTCGARTDNDLAAELKLDASTIALWRKRDTVPWSHAGTLHDRYGANLDWMIYGQDTIDHHYLYPPVSMFLPARARGGVDRLVDNAWSPAGYNTATPTGGPDRPYHVVVDRAASRRPMVTVPMTDDSMSPTIAYYDTALAALILPETTPAFDHSELHARLVIVAAGTWDTGGELVIRRLEKVAGGYDLSPDNRKYQSYSYIRRGAYASDYRLVGEVMAVLNLVGRGVGRSW